jgi:hypothetical protein
MVLRLFREIPAPAALAAAPQSLFNRVEQQVLGVNGVVGPKGTALANLAHGNGVIHHLMYQHSPEEVGAALMLAVLEALPQQEGVDLVVSNS